MWEACTIDPVADPQWLALLADSPGADVFHHPAWLELLRAQYGYELSAVCVRSLGGRIQAGLPIARIESRLTGRRLVALPFSDACAPALRRGEDEGLRPALGAALASACAENGLGLAVRAAVPEVPGGLVRLRYARHRLQLDSDPDRVAAGFSKAAARNTRRAAREGLRVERRTDATALRAFYRLHLKTRRRLGVPTQPHSFIAAFEDLFAAGLGFVAVVLDGGQVVAAAVFLGYGGTLTYKYGASERRALGKRPNNLLFAEVIAWACGANYATLDFGRTDLDNAGLRAFKHSWGAAELPHFHTYVAMPEPVAEHRVRERLLGAAIRRSPKSVGRLAGETLYGHFG